MSTARRRATKGGHPHRSASPCAWPSGRQARAETDPAASGASGPKGPRAHASVRAPHAGRACCGAPQCAQACTSLWWMRARLLARNQVVRPHDRALAVALRTWIGRRGLSRRRRAWLVLLGPKLRKGCPRRAYGRGVDMDTAAQGWPRSCGAWGAGPRPMLRAEPRPIWL